MLRTRLLLLVSVVGCGFDTAGDGSSGSSESSGTEADPSTTVNPTTTAPTTTAPTTTATTEPATDGTEVTTADTSASDTDEETTDDPDTGSSESTGNQAWGPFEDIMPIAEVNDLIASEDDPTLSGDMLEIFFNTNRLGQDDIFVATRESVDDPFDIPVLVVELTSPFTDTVPELSHDGLTMTLSNNTPGGQGFDVFISTRDDRESLWSMPERIDELNSIEGDGALVTTEDQLTAVLCRNFPGDGDYQLFSSTRRGDDDVWGDPALIEALLTDGRDCSPFLEADGARLWYGSTQTDLLEDENIYVVDMDGIEPDGNPVEVEELTTEFTDDDPWLSPDGTTIVFATNRDGQLEIYTARRELE